MNFKNIKKAYIIGIKGSGVVALAEIFHAWGIEVVGSDTKDKFFSDKILDRLGIRYYEHFSKSNVEAEKPDLVVYSTAYRPETNEELKFVIDGKLAVLSYPEAIGEIMKSKFSIAVCGTHGKTTTTAMLALALEQAGKDPTAIVGFGVKQFGGNVLVGKSDFFIFEADEYQNKFLHYNPLGVVLTSLDFDHPDFFSDFNQYKNAFKEFIRKIPRHGFLIACGDDVDVIEVSLSAPCKVIYYTEFPISNFAYSAEAAISAAKAGQFPNNFKTSNPNFQNYEVVSIPSGLDLQIPGKHNILNATAVFAVCKHLKLDEKKVVKALNSYQGANRRFERLGQCSGAEIIDDYAHHPAEIRATLKAVVERYKHKNIICVFHPHTFTRTKALFSEFSQSFDDCDELIVLDIYGSAREKQGGVHSMDLVNEIRKYKQNVEYIPTIAEAVKYLKGKLSSKDVLITMGAGNVNEIGQELVNSKQ
jgi:UDP-N-acetylmuramate--alanine ligase